MWENTWEGEAIDSISRGYLTRLCCMQEVSIWAEMGNMVGFLMWMRLCFPISPIIPDMVTGMKIIISSLFDSLWWNSKFALIIECLVTYGRSEIFDSAKFDRWVAMGMAPAIESSLKVYEEVLKLGFKIILLTGRSDRFRSVTIENLFEAGFRNWDILILRWFFCFCWFLLFWWTSFCICLLSCFISSPASFNWRIWNGALTIEIAFSNVELKN